MNSRAARGARWGEPVAPCRLVKRDGCKRRPLEVPTDRGARKGPQTHTNTHGPPYAGRALGDVRSVATCHYAITKRCPSRTGLPSFYRNASNNLGPGWCLLPPHLCSRPEQRRGCALKMGQTSVKLILHVVTPLEQVAVDNRFVTWNCTNVITSFFLKRSPVKIPQPNTHTSKRTFLP